MNYARTAAAVAVVAILGVTLASGPLVGAVDLTTATDEDPISPGSGTINLSVVSLPDSATLDRGQFGSGTYQLRVGDATVDVHSVTGTPQVRYKVKIPSIGYTRVTTTFLDSDRTGRQSISLVSAEVPPEKVEEDRYDGRLIVSTYDDSGFSTVVERDVNVEVRE